MYPPHVKCVCGHAEALHRIGVAGARKKRKECSASYCQCKGFNAIPGGSP